MEPFVAFSRVPIEVPLCACKLFPICNLPAVSCGHGIDVLRAVFLHHRLSLRCSSSFSFDRLLLLATFANKAPGIGSGYFNSSWFRRYEICLDRSL